MKTVREVYEQAQTDGFAVGAFNAANIETIKAIVSVANKLRSPVIIESSSGETKYFGAQNLADVVRNFSEEYNLPIFVNLDHAPTEEDVQEGIDAGYELIHFDGSALALDENLEITKKVVEKAHRKGLLVEAEIDQIGGGSSKHPDMTPEEALINHVYTPVEQLVKFVEESGIDTLAASFGNIHGVYKSAKNLNFERLAEIRSAVTCFLSMHGGSDIPFDQVKRAIEVGKIVKINVNTEMRLAFRKSLETQLQESDEVAIYKLMGPVIKAVEQVVEEKILLFGSANKA